MAEETKVMSLATKIGIGVITTLVTGMITWMVVTVNKNEDNIKLMHYQDNMYNALFQELYEYHSVNKTGMLGRMDRKLMMKASSNSDEIKTESETMVGSAPKDK